jgi:hypothetical protein
MKNYRSNQARLVGCRLVVALTFITAPLIKAAGPIGVDGGWVIDNSGNILLTPAQCSAYTANGVGWLRVNMRLVNGNTTWNSTMLGYYDTAINNAIAAGIQCVILMGGEAWTGGQSSWSANNHENNSGANGDNAYIDNFVSGAVGPIVAHFHDRVKVYEIWNEPSTWTTHSGSTYSGATFMYPSCYSWLLTKSWQQVHNVLGLNDCTVISGGIFGTTDLPSNDPNYVSENSGAGWLTRVFQQGNSSAVNSFLSNRNSYGVYPADGYGQHLYIDYNTQTTTANVSTYGNAVRNAYNGNDPGKGTWMTEFGWTTTYVSQNIQAANLTTTFNWCNVGAVSAYVKYASWFTWQDGGAGNFGLIDGSGNHKTSYVNFGNEANYQGRTAINNGGVNSNILNYFNGRGQSILGNPFNNGGSAWVHTWGGANVQDYNGGSDGHNTVFDSSWGTFHVDDVHGLWMYYQQNGGVGAFGIPKNEEHPGGGGYQQDFANGTLTWASGAISWQANPANLFYTSFETSQTLPTWSDTIDSSINVSGYHSGINPECSTRQEQAHSGTTALMYSGTDNSASSSYVYFKVFSVNIPITSATKMSYWIYPQQTNGMYVAVDYHCTDNTTLRDSGALDYNGFSMHPNAGHGGNLPLNAWANIKCNVGQWLAGKTVDKIWVAYDHPPATGQFRGYIDDIKITNNSIP